MKKLFAAAVIAISALGFTATANAAGCEISANGLTAEQVQKLRVQCEQEQLKRLEETSQASSQASEKPEEPMVSKEALTEWGQFAQDIAKAIGVAAQELNIAVNEFITSPAGILTVAILLFNFGGELFFGFLIGVPLLIIHIMITRAAWNHLMVEHVEYERVWFGMRKVVKEITKKPATEERNWGMLILALYFFIGIWIIVGGVIF